MGTRHAHVFVELYEWKKQIHADFPNKQNVVVVAV